VLDVQHVRKRFGDVVALDDVSFSVGRSALVGFLGPNGSGKTTTMRAVMGLISIDDGTATWDGAPISATVRRRFGYMPAERGMYPKMTVRHQLVYFARLAGLSSKQAADAAGEWMERVGVASRAEDEVQALSSGNQQRVQLAIALVHDPDLLILDEPFSGLDPMAVENMKHILLEQVRRGTSVLFSSHQLNLVSDISRQVVIVDRGRIVLDGDVRELRDRSDVRYASVTFAAPTTWRPTFDHIYEVERSDRSVRLQVPAAIDPSAVLADASTAGHVVEFSFAPPDLSEVFLAAVGRTNAADELEEAS
jgi:ABC-2 type transport system ATP-binding protein